MQIDIQARDFALTEDLRIHAERRLRFALTCYVDRIQRVAIRLSDVNGPRDGADKHCHLRVMIANLPDVVIEDTELDLLLAIDRAADRAGRTVGRRLKTLARW